MRGMLKSEKWLRRLGKEKLGAAGLTTELCDIMKMLNQMTTDSLTRR